jgi:3-methylfumaryl-CoA hydratase
MSDKGTRWSPSISCAAGSAGPIVHGPLLATLLLDLLLRERPRATVTRFEFRALKPVFDTAPFFVCGRPAQDRATVALWAKDAEGRLCMDASATIAGEA